jgi:RNA polymerase sigma factor (sigma-70 family)
MRAAELVRRAQGGERDAVNELFLRELPPLRRWTFSHVPAAVRRSGDADDFVQIALLRTLRRLPHLRLNGDETLQPYLRRTVLNLIRDHGRAAGGRPLMVGVDEHSTSSRHTALDVLLARETVRQYRQALGLLSTRERAALVARLEHGWDYRQVAAHAGCLTESAARVMVGRALKRVLANVREQRLQRRRRGVRPPAARR